MRNEPASRVVLEIDVAEDAVARAMDQAYAQLVRRIQVPGFRRGKAPRPILERHLGTETLREEALRQLVPQQYSEAVAQTGVSPITRPSIEVKDAPDGRGLHLTATVDVYPAIALPDYRQIRVAAEQTPVTAQDVDRAIEDIRARHGRLSGVAEPARRGDFVLLTVVSAPEGHERLQPGKELLVEVSGGLLPEPVEAALEGASAGDERRAELPGAAQPVVVRVGDVRRKDLPALDDAFARTVSDRQTLAELREALREKIAAERTAEESRALRERVLDAVLAQATFDVPESLVEREVERMLDDLADHLRSRGLTLESYARALEKDEAALRADMREGALRRVRSRLLLETVAEREALSVSEEEMRGEVENLAAELKQDVAKVQAWLAEAGRQEGLRETLLRRKAMAFLVDAVSGAETPAAAGSAPDDSASRRRPPAPPSSP
ncbi:MAG TPA: trigger factor [bacterium]|nr:trigger factor [bacterium]